MHFSKTIKHVLGHRIELKSLHLGNDGDWKNLDERYKSEFLKKVKDYQVKLKNASHNTRVFLMRYWSDGF